MKSFYKKIYRLILDVLINPEEKLKRINKNLEENKKEYIKILNTYNKNTLLVDMREFIEETITNDLYLIEIIRKLKIKYRFSRKKLKEIIKHIEYYHILQKELIESPNWDYEEQFKYKESFNYLEMKEIIKTLSVF